MILHPLHMQTNAPHLPQPLCALLPDMDKGSQKIHALKYS